MVKQRNKLKVGDIVITVKGCRFNGPPGNMEVVTTGKKWGKYNSVVCRKPDGRVSAFLEKNLRLVE